MLEINILFRRGLMKPSISGFQLNTDVLSILILRYMRKDGTLRFGDFVSAILHLSDAFGMFIMRRLISLYNLIYLSS